MFAQRHQKLVIELTRVMAIAVALLMLTVLTVARSQAAFSDTTVNTGNAFSTGTVVLTDDDGDGAPAASALFNAVALNPGTPLEKCIVITYSGSLLDADIKMYGTSTGDLAQYVDTTIEIGTGGAFDPTGTGCAGFVVDALAPSYTGDLADFTANNSDWLTGFATHTATATPTVKTIKFTVSVQDVPAAQGKTATADFTWEAQNQ